MNRFRNHLISHCFMMCAVYFHYIVYTQQLDTHNCIVYTIHKRRTFTNTFVSGAVLKCCLRLKLNPACMENVWHSVISQLWASDSVKQYNSPVNNSTTLCCKSASFPNTKFTNICPPINTVVKEEVVMCDSFCTALHRLRECKS